MVNQRRVDALAGQEWVTARLPVSARIPARARDGAEPKPAVAIGRDGVHVIVDQAIPLRFVLLDGESARHGVRVKEEAALGPGPQAAVVILEDRKHLEAFIVIQQRMALPGTILVVNQAVACPGPDAAILPCPQRQRPLTDQRALAQGLPAVRLPALPDATAGHARHQITFGRDGEGLNIRARYR